MELAFRSDLLVGVFENLGVLFLFNVGLRYWRKLLKDCWEGSFGKKEGYEVSAFEYSQKAKKSFASVYTWSLYLDTPT